MPSCAALSTPLVYLQPKESINTRLQLAKLHSATGVAKSFISTLPYSHVLMMRAKSFPLPGVFQPMRRLLGFSAQFAGLLLLWLVFAAQISANELLFGVIAVAAAMFALHTCLSHEPLDFKPRAAWLVQAWRLPLDIAKDLRILFRVLFLRLKRKPVPGVFRLVPFKCSGVGSRAGAKRALALLYLSISPNSVVVGIDQEKKNALLHQLLPAPVSLLKHKLEEE